MIIIWQIIILSFKSRHKAVGQNTVSHAQSEDKTLSNVWNVSKIS